MKVELEKYSNKIICVAVSGGKDSMALLHYLRANGGGYGITVCAVNCDHAIRGAASEADSAFVRKYCEDAGVPLISFKRAAGEISEQGARLWRYGCFLAAVKPSEGWQGADYVATAHHLSDNAETVLFNIARGSGISGACGIAESEDYKINGGEFTVIRPLISVTRAEIDEYIASNGIPYVTDESNLTCDYTRNKIRHNVIPALEDAVPEAERAIFRFSRIAAETEKYFDDYIEKNDVVCGICGGQLIKLCGERAVFSRAALKVFAGFNLKDYTSEHIDKLYNLQFSPSGTRFEFLNLTAAREERGVSICKNGVHGGSTELALDEALAEDFSYFCGEKCLFIGDTYSLVIGSNDKVLRFDLDKIPSGAVVRFRRAGDRFTKFGGGTKSLGDYFTDKKVPARLRDRVPLVAVGSDVLVVGGVEIADSVKITDTSTNIYYILCSDYLKV